MIDYRAIERCGLCANFEADVPGAVYLEGGNGFCKRKRISTKLHERRSDTDWCEQFNRAGGTGDNR